MRWWPFRRAVETRGYTDAIVDALVTAAAGSETANVQATAALEACAGWWARALATAEVRPQTPATMAVQPHVLAAIGRGLCRYGAALFVLDAGGGAGLRLHQAADWDVRGGADPDTWRYRVTLAGPDTTESVDVPAAGVCHFRYATDPMRPWEGIGPLQAARESGKLAANVERHLADESGGPVGSIIPLPEGVNGAAALKTALGKLRGNVALPETTAGGSGQGAGAAPHRDWRPERLGANPPAGLVSLRTEVGAAVAAACGIGPGLLSAAADGTGQRESYRRFLHATLRPLAAIVEDELRAKLDAADLALDFTDLQAADVQGRARAFKSLTDGGIDPPLAARVVGVEVGA